MDFRFFREKQNLESFILGLENIVRRLIKFLKLAQLY